MHPEDIESLFYKVSIGDPVRIIHKPYKIGRHYNQVFVEVHEPITPEKAWLLTSHEQLAPLELPEVDGAGVRRPAAIRNKIRNRISRAHAVAVPKATETERRELEGHH